MNSIEIWKPVLGYEGIYEVSNFGNVKSLKFGKEKILKLLKTGRYRNYHQVILCKNKEKKQVHVHRLVYEAFVDRIPEGLTIDHKDNVGTNNKLENLHVMTQEENNRKAHLGRKCSAETRKKMSLARIGKKYAPHKKKSKTFLLNLPPAISRFLKEEIHKEFPDEIVIEKGA